MPLKQIPGAFDVRFGERHVRFALTNRGLGDLESRLSLSDLFLYFLIFDLGHALAPADLVAQSHEHLLQATSGFRHDRHGGIANQVAHQGQLLRHLRTPDRGHFDREGAGWATPSTPAATSGDSTCPIARGRAGSTRNALPPARGVIAWLATSRCRRAAEVASIVGSARKSRHDHERSDELFHEQSKYRVRVAGPPCLSCLQH